MQEQFGNDGGHPSGKASHNHEPLNPEPYDAGCKGFDGTYTEWKSISTSRASWTPDPRGPYSIHLGLKYFSWNAFGP